MAHILDVDMNGCKGLEVLVAVPFGNMADQLIQALKSLSCKPYLALSGEDAVNKIRFSSFSAVVYVSGYSSELHQVISKMPMSSRRNFLYVYLDSDVQTNDSMLAYSLSANLVINTGELDSFKELFETYSSDYNKMYRVYAALSKSIET